MPFIALWPPFCQKGSCICVLCCCGGRETLAFLALSRPFCLKNKKSTRAIACGWEED